MATDATTLLFIEQTVGDDYIHSVPIGGGSTSTLFASPEITGLAVLGNELYFHRGFLMHMPLAGGTPAEVETPLFVFPRGPVASGGFLYLIEVPSGSGRRFSRIDRPAAESDYLHSFFGVSDHYAVAASQLVYEVGDASASEVRRVALP